MKGLCGSQPLKVAQVDGFGGNSWRKITRAELADELSVCPNVKVTYTQADGDLQKYIIDINSYVAQGYNAIITYDDFGSQALSALHNAYKAGVVVVPYIASPSGTVGVDYNGYVQYNFTAEGQEMAKWLHGELKPGAKVLFTGGLAGGSPSTVALYDAIKNTAGTLGNPFEFLTNQPQPSGWDPAVDQQQMAGALAHYPVINAIASDYGVADLGGLRAFLSANRQIPALATSATDNQLGCFWLQYHKTNPNFQLLTLDGTTRVVRIAALKAMAALDHKPDTYPEQPDLITFIDTAHGKTPTCNTSLPQDADLSSLLSTTQLQALFG